MCSVAVLTPRTVLHRSAVCIRTWTSSRPAPQCPLCNAVVHYLKRDDIIEVSVSYLNLCDSFRAPASTATNSFHCPSRI